jgi:dTDP-4-amino-4,6-dideoxygalactose transaminase
MGLTSLESLSDFIQTNRQNYQQYQEGLADENNLRLLTFDENEKYNYQYVVAEIDEAAAGVSRDELIKILHAENVIARRYFYPGCHRMEPYRSSSRYAGLELPVTERLADRVITLPTGTALSSPHISNICELIKWVISHGPEVHGRLSRLPA